MLAEVVGEGSRLESLKALRDFLARSLEEVAAKEAAPLSRQLTDVLEQIDSLSAGEKPKEASPLDQFTARLRSKRSSDPTAVG